MADKPLYSTATGRQVKDNLKKSQSYQKVDGPAKMRLESKGRGGKSVTVVFNLPFDENAAKNFASEMKSHFGCGGTFKDSTIELAGDMREKIEAFFSKKGLEIKRAGG